MRCGGECSGSCKRERNTTIGAYAARQRQATAEAYAHARVHEQMRMRMHGYDDVHEHVLAHVLGCTYATAHAYVAYCILYIARRR